MKQSKKHHYNRAEKRLLLRDNGGLLSDDDKAVAYVCDHLTFEGLRRLAKTINFFAKGK